MQGIGNRGQGTGNREQGIGEALAKLDCEDDYLAPEGPSIIAQDGAKRNPGKGSVPGKGRPGFPQRMVGCKYLFCGKDRSPESVF